MIFINSFKWQQTLWATQNSKTLYIVPIIQSTWNHLWHLLTLALPSVLWRCWLGSRKGIRPVKNWAVGCWRVICLEWGADLHNSQLMPLPLTVSCFSKIQTGFTFLVPAHLGSPGKRAVKQVCVCVCVTLALDAVTRLLLAFASCYSIFLQCYLFKCFTT